MLPAAGVVILGSHIKPRRPFAPTARPGHTACSTSLAVRLLCWLPDCRGRFMTWRAVYARDSAEIMYSGDTTGFEILNAKAEFFAHPFETPPRYVLCDFSGIQGFHIAPADVKRIVQQDREAARVNPELAEAVVAPTPLSYGMSRMWELLVADARPLTVVQPTRAKAIAWLHEQDIGLTPAHRRELAAPASGA